MNNEQLKEIESWIGRHKATEFSMDKGHGIEYESINPNGHIQQLVNEVRRLLAERDSDRAHTYRLVKRIRKLNVEIDGGIDDDDVPHQGWKDLVDVLKKRVGELEKEKDEIVRTALRNNNKIKFQFEIPETEKELTLCKSLLAEQTNRARLAESERNCVKKMFNEEMIKCHAFIQDPKRAKCNEFYMHAGYSVIEKIIDYAKKLEDMTEAVSRAGYGMRMIVDKDGGRFYFIVKE